MVGIFFLAFLFFIRPLACHPANDKWSASSYQYSTPDHYGREYRGNILVEKKPSYAKEGDPKNEYKEYIYEILCGEIKATDLALVYFTFCLVMVGWATMQNVDETARRTERAYVFGGGPFGPTKPRWVEALKNGTVYREAKHFKDPRRMTIYNYGRTAAFITRVEYGFCDELPEGMRVSKAMDSGALKYCIVPSPSNVFPPAGTGEAAYFLYRHVEFDRSDYEGKIFFGRIWYRDIFKCEHFSTFSLRLTKDGHSDPVGVSYSDDWS